MADSRTLERAIAVSRALGANSMTICDCGNSTFFVALENNPPENHIRSLICSKCNHQMPVPFRQGS